MEEQKKKVAIPPKPKYDILQIAGEVKVPQVVETIKKAFGVEPESSDFIIKFTHRGEKVEIYYNGNSFNIVESETSSVILKRIAIYHGGTLTQRIKKIKTDEKPKEKLNK